MGAAASDVIIIGGGLHGSSAAFHLARLGARVVVLEKDYVGRHASGVNAGGVRTLGRHPAELPLAVAAKRIWHAIADWVDDDCGFRAVGQIRLADSEARVAELVARSEMVARLGIDHREMVIDAAAVREMLPAAKPSSLGALYVEGDGYANPFRTTQAFQRASERRGVRFVERAAVHSLARKAGAWTVRTEDGGVFTASLLVNCAGAWGDRMAAMIGDAVPLTANGSMMMITARMPAFVTPVVGAAGRSLSLKQFENGTVLIGGGHRAPVDRRTNQTSIDISGLARAASTALDLFPVLNTTQVVRFWSGIEGFTPDGLPVIGASLNAEGAFHAFGFSAHGFQLGPIVGRIIAELALQGRTDLPITPFSVARFQRQAAA